MRRPWLLIGAGAAALAVDQASKLAADRWLPYGQPQALLPGVALTYVHNPGAAFSLLAGLPLAFRLPFFCAVALAALGAVAVYWRALPGPDRWSEAALGLIVGGALGNLLDRLRLGGVVLDFIELGVRGVFTWPVFNVADSAVTVGVAILIIQTMFPGRASGGS